MNRLKAVIPTALCVARLLMTPVLFLFAQQDDARAFLYWAYLIVLTDLLDGPLARAWRVTSITGQRLDGLADTVFYAVFFSLSLTLMGDEALGYWFFLCLPLLWLVLPLPAGYFLTGSVRSMHLWSKRAISYLFIPWVSLAVVGRFSVALLAAINLLALLSCVEEMLIYNLARGRINETVSSVFQARRQLMDTT